MIYSKRIYRDIIEKILFIFGILLLFFLLFYLYLYNYVDKSNNKVNLNNIASKFTEIREEFEDSLNENKKIYEKSLNKGKTDDLIDEYYRLLNKTKLDFQINFYPNDKDNFKIGKNIADINSFKNYQNIINSITDDLYESSINSSDNGVFVINKRYDEGFVAIYITMASLHKSLSLVGDDYYITDIHKKILLSDVNEVNISKNSINKISDDLFDDGNFVEAEKKIGDFFIHSVKKRSITESEFIIFLTIIMLLALIFLYVLMSSIRKTIDYSTKSIEILKAEIGLVSEGKISKINLKTDDEIDEIIVNINELIKSRKILLDKNLKLKYLNKFNEFKMLESQFNPHFLYNTLELISITIYMSDIKTTDLIIDNLTSILRYSINEMSFLRLEEDIIYINKFLEIQKIKREENFIYNINIDEASKEILIPKLFLQPLIENSLKYAYQTTSFVTIDIDIEYKDDIFILYVKDNGESLSDEKIDKLNKHIIIDSSEEYLTMEHHGISNTYNRLKMLYKDNLIMKFIKNDKGVTLMIKIYTKGINHD